jgi:hypothetical protein
MRSRFLAPLLALAALCVTLRAEAIPIEDHDLDFSIDVDGPDAALCVANPPELADYILCIGLDPDSMVPDAKPGLRPGPVVFLRMTDWSMGLVTTFGDAPEAGRLVDEDGAQLSSSLRDALVRAGRVVKIHGVKGASYDLVTVAGRPAVRTIAECQDSVPAPKVMPSAVRPGASVIPMITASPMIPAASASAPIDEDPEVACESKIIYWTTASNTLITMSFSVARDRLQEAQPIIDAMLGTMKVSQPLARARLRPTTRDQAEKLARRYAAPMAVIIAVIGFFYGMIRRGARKPGRDVTS